MQTRETLKQLALLPHQSPEIPGIPGLSGLNLLGSLLGGLFGGGGGGAGGAGGSSSSSTNVSNLSPDPLAGSNIDTFANSDQPQVPTNTILPTDQFADTTGGTGGQGGGGGFFSTGGGGGGGGGGGSATNQTSVQLQSNPYNYQNTQIFNPNQNAGMAAEGLGSALKPEMLQPSYSNPMSPLQGLVAMTQSPGFQAPNIAPSMPQQMPQDRVGGGGGSLPISLPQQNNQPGQPAPIQPSITNGGGGGDNIAQQTDSDLSGLLARSLGNGGAPGATGATAYMPQGPADPGATVGASIPLPRGGSMPLPDAANPVALANGFVPPPPPSAPGMAFAGGAPSSPLQGGASELGVPDSGNPDADNQSLQQQLQTLGKKGQDLATKMDLETERAKNKHLTEWGPKLAKAEFEHQKANDTYAKTGAIKSHQEALDNAYQSMDYPEQQLFNQYRHERLSQVWNEQHPEAPRKTGQPIPPTFSEAVRAYQELRRGGSGSHPFLRAIAGAASAFAQGSEPLLSSGRMYANQNGTLYPGSTRPLMTPENIYQSMKDQYNEQAAQYKNMMDAGAELDKTFRSRVDNAMNKENPEYKEAKDRVDQTRKDYDDTRKAADSDYAKAMKIIQDSYKLQGGFLKSTGQMMGRQISNNRANETGRHNLQTEGIGKTNADAHKVSAGASANRAGTEVKKENRLENPGVNSEGVPLRGKTLPIEDYRKLLLNDIQSGKITREQANRAMRTASYQGPEKQ